MAQLNYGFQARLAKYFIDRLGMVAYRRGWMKGDCPDCGKKGKFGVNLSLNKTNCFRCGYKVKPLQVVVDIEPSITSWAEAQNYIGAFEEAEYLETPSEFLPEKDARLPLGYTSIVLGNGALGKKARAYMASRGFDLYDLAMQGVGYCRGRGRYWGRIIIPFYEGGKLVYFNARKFIGGGTKFDNPKIEDFGVGKSSLIYNVDALHLYSKIYIVESATNVLTLGENAIAGGGKVFSGYQISKLLQSPVRDFIIILDPDALLEAIKLALELINHKNIKLVMLPDKVYHRGSRKSKEADVNVLGRRKTLQFVKKSKWVTFADLIGLKIAYERAKYSYN